jgi:hypothetical protein
VDVYCYTILLGLTDSSTQQWPSSRRYLTSGLLTFCRPLSLSHDLQSSPGTTTCYLVEQCHLFRWYPPGCGLWCLPSPPNHSAQDDPRRHHRALATGIVRVRPYMRSYYVISHLSDHYKGLLSDTTVCTPIDPSKRRLAYALYSRCLGLVQSRVR